MPRPLDRADRAALLSELCTTVFLFRKDAMEFYQITEQEVFEKAMTL